MKLNNGQLMTGQYVEFDCSHVVANQTANLTAILGAQAMVQIM